MRLIKRKAAAAKCGVCIDTTYEWGNPKSPYYDPDFPKPIALSATSRARFLIDEEIDEFIAQKAARRESIKPNRRVPRPRRENRQGGAA